MLIYICEDSKSDLERLLHHLRTYSKEMAYSFHVKPFSSGEALLHSLNTQQEQPVLVFLDIYMEQMSGIEVAKQIRNAGITSGIIFTTASLEHAMDSYEVEALYYLQKPYTHEHFRKAMERCDHLFADQCKSYTISVRGKEQSIPYKDIIFFETGNHSVILHTEAEQFSFIHSLSQVVKDLAAEDNFTACGRSFCINLLHVKDYIGNDLQMTDGSIIPVPVREREHIRETLQQWKNRK